MQEATRLNSGSDFGGEHSGRSLLEEVSWHLGDQGVVEAVVELAGRRDRDEGERLWDLAGGDPTAGPEARLHPEVPGTGRRRWWLLTTTSS